MHLSAALLASALLSIPAALANPVLFKSRNPTPVGHVSKRDIKDRICGDENFYSSSFQSKTFEYASQSLSGIGLTVRGTNDVKYPHTFHNNEDLDLPECSGVPGPFQEFPIRQGGLLFTDGVAPGTDRIIYKITGTAPESGLPDTFTYCGVITHIGLPNNEFGDCDAA